MPGKAPVPVPSAPGSSSILSSSSTDPELFHQLGHSSSVLALAVSNEYIFAGTQDGEISVWSLETLELVHTIQAHKRSVLALYLTPDNSLLFSSAGDPFVNVWCPKSLNRLYEIYSTHDVGDIFCLAYSAQHDTVYFGAQNTSIQWACLGDPSNKSSHQSAKHPELRNHRFFDSKAPGGTSTPRRTDERWDLIPKPDTVLEVAQGSIRQYAHFGYVYCMLPAKGATVLVDSEDEVLITGGGDGTIKLWKLGGNKEEDGSEEDAIREIATLGHDDAESVMSLAIDGSFLYSGKLDGFVELWDLDTKQKLRVIKAHKGDVMTVQMAWGYMWSASAVGSACKHTTVHYGKYRHASSESVAQKYQCASRWKAHNGKILASATSNKGTNQFFITGGNDNTVSMWKVNEPPTTLVAQSEGEAEDMMFTSLREFVSFKTVSSRPEFSEDCRKGATFLRVLFKRLGAHVEMLTSASSYNPVVFARFAGKMEPAEKKRILFYGHYDVVVADNKRGEWEGDPFTMRGSDGYLYGRGVSDNKGPIIAALYAVTDLMARKKLDSDVLFLIEGEEEEGSRGFQETVRRFRDGVIGRVDYILIANSYWLDDNVPCLTYGLRGVLHATVCINSKSPDLHSGVDGSFLVDEPLSDLTKLLAKLKGKGNRVMVPGFYDGILPLTEEEDGRFDEIVECILERHPEKGPSETLKRGLMARWREPNVTIHRFKVSGPEGSLVSSHASANVSFRLVPGQEIEDVIECVRGWLEEEFAKTGSGNEIGVTIDNRAEPWLGDTGNEIFGTLEGAVMEVWGPVLGVEPERPGTAGSADVEEGNRGLEGGGLGGTGVRGSFGGQAVGGAGARGSFGPGPTSFAPGGGGTGGGVVATGGGGGRGVKPRSKPLYIREGGSIPAIRFLEKEFGAPAAHFPCGQASDAAHLANERMRVRNLVKSREVFGLVFSRL